MARKKGKRPKLRNHIAAVLEMSIGKRPRILPIHQRAMPERPEGYFEERKLLKAERRDLIIYGHKQRNEGRPLEYQGTAHDELCADMRLLGCTEVQIAAAMFIDVATFNKWRNQFPMFSAAWESGGDMADAAIMRKMHQKAMGYKMNTTRVFYDSKIGEVIEHDIVEVFAPDQKAAEFIITNRQRANWRHRQDNSLVDTDGNTMQPPTLTILPVQAMPRKDDD